MSSSHLERTRQAANTLNNRLSDLMELAQVPDGSGTERRVEKALASVYEAIDEIPRVASRPSVLNENGPLVYPIKGADMRSWKTSEGTRAGTLIRGRKARIASRARAIMANPTSIPRRVMTASQYHRALDEARIDEPSPITAGESDFSYVTVARN
jgi:hypothetical protein